MVERHFREIDLLLEFRVDALEAPGYDLDELSDELDARLRAHIDAFGLAGRAAIEAVVEPALQPSRLNASLGAAVALTILAVGTSGTRRSVMGGRILWATAGARSGSPAFWTTPSSGRSRPS